MATKDGSFYNCGENFIFIHIPRTAGTSILKTLIDEKAIQRASSHFVLDHFPRPDYEIDEFLFTFVRNPFDRLVSIYYWLTDYLHRHDKNNYRKTTNVYKFNTTFYDWFYWRYIDGNHNWFVDYEKTKAWRKVLPTSNLMTASLNHYASFGYEPQVSFITNNSTNKIEADFVGRFENINEDWNKLKNILNFKSDLQHVNKSTIKNYRDYYTEDMKKIVFDIYRQDFECFNYDW